MISLVVRRTIDAGARRLFEAWTEPSQLMQWWGPEPVRCTAAEVDLRIGGRYRIANQFPDGSVIWICGEFARIEPPHLLVSTWSIEPRAETRELVTVRFTPRGAATEVSVVHERILDAVTRERHRAGWNGCIDRLRAYAGGGAAQSTA